MQAAVGLHQHQQSHQEPDAEEVLFVLMTSNDMHHIVDWGNAAGGLLRLTWCTLGTGARHRLAAARVDQHHPLMGTERVVAGLCSPQQRVGE